MKLTEENADFQDCRPLSDKPINMDLVPEHLKARMKARAEARKAETSARPLAAE